MSYLTGSKRLLCPSWAIGQYRGAMVLVWHVPTHIDERLSLKWQRRDGCIYKAKRYVLVIPGKCHETDRNQELLWLFEKG